MATKSIVGRVRSTQLEQSLSSTIVADYVSAIDNNYVSLLQSKGENIMIPSLDYFMDVLAPESRGRFVDLYNRTMGLEDGVENIPDEVKAVQGALFDGLCFGYDTSNDSVALYTMNFDLLMNDLGISRDMTAMCMRSNIIGQFKGFRIDVEYNVGPETFDFKAVNHRKVLDNETVIFIPYIACVRLMKMIESFLSSGAVLKVKQDYNGTDKTRYITRNESVLAKFCDSPEAVKGLEPSFFPLKAFFYAPVLGAPSTTAMVTNVKLFNLCEVKKIKADRVSALGISKPTDPMRSIVEDRVFAQNMSSLVMNNPYAAAKVVDNLPKGTEFFSKIDNVSQIYESVFSKYLHGLSDKEREEAIAAVPNVSEEVQNIMSVFEGSKGRVLDRSEYENLYSLKELLRNHVCRFIIRKKDCSLSSMLGTNNKQILSKVYGEDYFAAYESAGARLYRVLDEVDSGKDIVSALADYGFHCNKDVAYELLEKYKAATANGREISDEFRKEAADLLGFKTRASSTSETAVMFRSLNGIITEDGVMEYYKNIDPSKVVNAMVIC